MPSMSTIEVFVGEQVILHDNILWDAQDSQEDRSGKTGPVLACRTMEENGPSIR